MLPAALLNAAIGRFSSVSPWIAAVGAVTFALFSVGVLLLEFNRGDSLSSRPAAAARTHHYIITHDVVDASALDPRRRNARRQDRNGQIDRRVSVGSDRGLRVPG